MSTDLEKATAQPPPRRLNTFTASFVEASATWEELTRGWPIECTVPWLTAEYGRVTDRQYVTVVRDHDRPLAGAVWYLLDGTEERHGYAAYDMLLGTEFETSAQHLGATAGQRRHEALALQEELHAATLSPCVGVALPGCYESALAWDTRLDARKLDEALRALVDALEESARSLGAQSIAIQNTSDGPAGQLLLHAGYLSAAQPPVAVLDVPDDGLNGYLTRLTAKQRKNCRREIRKFAEAVNSVEVFGAERLLLPDIVRLLEIRYQKYGHATSPRGIEDRLERVQELPGLKVLVAERNGRACAFKAFIVDAPRRRIVSRFSGCEPNDYYAYFNMVYYQPIRLAPHWDVTSIELGTESYHAKVTRGSRLEARTVFLKPLDTELHTTVQKACVLRSAVEDERLKAELTSTTRKEK